MKYDRPKAGEWVQPIKHGYKLCCCDCGLVHTVNFRVVKQGKRSKVQFQVYRNNRSTALVRRHQLNSK